MIDLSWAEIGCISLIALICIGPKELPSVLRNVGRLVRQAKDYSQAFFASLESIADETGKPAKSIIYDDNGRPYLAYNVDDLLSPPSKGDDPPVSS